PGVPMSDIGKALQIPAPADTTTRTLTVYIGAQNGNGRLTAHLSDGSATDYVNSLTAGRQRSDGVYTLTYQAASAGQTITVSWILAGGPKGSLSGGRGGNVSVQGAALASTSAPPPPTTSACPCSLWSSAAVPT